MAASARNYYRAALERIEDAYLLHSQGHYPFAMYASGLAVECLLRAFRLLRDPSFDERHDLWRLWKKTALAEVRKSPTYERMYALLSEVNVRWRNSYRFASIQEVNSFLKGASLDRGIKCDYVKFNSKKLYESAKELLLLGGPKWARLNEK